MPQFVFRAARTRKFFRRRRRSTAGEMDSPDSHRSRSMPSIRNSSTVSRFASKSGSRRACASNARSPSPRSALNPARRQLFFVDARRRKCLRALPERRGHPAGDYRLRSLQDVASLHLRRRGRRQCVAVVSLHRLRSEFYGEEADANLLFQRTLKEAVHEFGHALGAQTLLQRAVRDVLFEFGFRNGQQNAALLRGVRAPPQGAPAKKARFLGAASARHPKRARH